MTDIEHEMAILQDERDRARKALKELQTRYGKVFNSRARNAVRQVKLEDLEAQNRWLREVLQYFKDRGYYEAWKALDPKESADWLDRALKEDKP